jgi:hypothetical protein
MGRRVRKHAGSNRCLQIETALTTVLTVFAISGEQEIVNTLSLTEIVMCSMLNLIICELLWCICSLIGTRPIFEFSSGSQPCRNLYFSFSCEQLGNTIDTRSDFLTCFLCYWFIVVNFTPLASGLTDLVSFTHIYDQFTCNYVASFAHL